MANVRKDQAKLTDAEKTAYVNAVLALKNSVPSQLGLTNRYDDYVQIHMESMMASPGWAHRGPAFGPWHRALLRNLELDLQAVDPSVTIPYWDWTVQNSPDPTMTGSPWIDLFMGGDGDPSQGGSVMTGPFASGQWTLNITEENTQQPLTRNFGGQQPTLPTVANVQGALQETPYDTSPWGQGDNPSFRDRLEGWHGAGSIHNRVHLWVGGSMLPSTSPNDPVFFLHHCNVDRLWAEWQAQHTDQPYAPGDDVADAPQGHKLDDPMQPWGGAVTVASTLNHHALGYSYDTEPPPPVAFQALPSPYALPVWTYQLKVPPGQAMKMPTMFDISPDDKAAGGHDPGSGS